MANDGPVIPHYSEFRHREASILTRATGLLRLGSGVQGPWSQGPKNYERLRDDDRRPFFGNGEPFKLKSIRKEHWSAGADIEVRER